MRGLRCGGRGARPGGRRRRRELDRGGSVSILRVEPEPPADYKCEFTNITVDATLQLASKESESSTSHLITAFLEDIIKENY